MPETNNIEKRVHRIELRAASAEGQPASRTVVGYAAVFNSESEDLGYFTEVIEPGAFTEAIGQSDIRALFNHDPNYILARTPGTLKVTEDERGLRYEFDAPETSFGNDFLVMLQRGDVSQSSFSFTVKDESWDMEKLPNGDYKHTRRIKKVDRIYDVAPVTYPAYPDTEVARRSLPKAPEEQTQTPDGELINRQLRLRMAAAVNKV